MPSPEAIYGTGGGNLYDSLLHRIVSTTNALSDSWRLLTLEQYVRSHTLRAQLGQAPDGIALAPTLDMPGDTGYPEQIALNPWTDVRPDSVQIDDETFIVGSPLPQNPGAPAVPDTHLKRFLTDPTNAAIERLYPLGTGVPDDITTSSASTPNSGAPYIEITQVHTSPMLIALYSGDADGSWNGWNDESAFASNVNDNTGFQLAGNNFEPGIAGLFVGFPATGNLGKFLSGLTVRLTYDVNDVPSHAIMAAMYNSAAGWTALPNFADGTVGPTGNTVYPTLTLAQTGTITWTVPDGAMAPVAGGDFSGFVSSTGSHHHITDLGGSFATPNNYYWVYLYLLTEPTNPTITNATIWQIEPIGGWAIAPGTYGCAITEIDEHGRESSPNSVFTVAVGAPDSPYDQYQFIFHRNTSVNTYNAPYAAPPIAGDGQRCGFNYYRTTNGGSVPYLVQTFNYDPSWDVSGVPAYTDAMTDTELAASNALPEFGSLNPPHSASCCGSKDGRLILNDLLQDGYIQISAASGPTQFNVLGDPTNPGSGISLLAARPGEKVVAIANWGSMRLIFTTGSIFTLEGSDTTQYVTRYACDGGCAGRDTVVEMGDGVYFLRMDGQVCVYAGGTPQPISLPIDDVFRGTYVTEDGFQTPVMTAANTACAWRMADCYCISIAGRTLIYDTLVKGWCEAPYGWVRWAITTTLEPAQTSPSISEVSASWPLYGRYGDPRSPEVTLLGPCAAGEAAGTTLFALCPEFPLQGLSTLPIAGEIAYAPFSGEQTNFAVETVRRPVLVTVWGSGGAGTLNCTSSFGGNETYTFAARGDGLGHLVRQGFVDMAGETHTLTLSFPDATTVLIGEARMEYVRKS